MLHRIRKTFGMPIEVEHVVAPLLRIPEQLEDLAVSKVKQRDWHEQMSAHHNDRRETAHREADKAVSIANKLRELLS